MISIANFKERFYFIQDFEPYFHALGENYFIAEQTYKLGLCGLCAGDWLMQCVGNFDMWARKWEFAYDKDVYFANRRNSRAPDREFKIAFYARGYTPRRGKLLGIAAFEEMRKRGYRFRVSRSERRRAARRSASPARNVGSSLRRVWRTSTTNATSGSCFRRPTTLWCLSR